MPDFTILANLAKAVEEYGYGNISYALLITFFVYFGKNLINGTKEQTNLIVAELKKIHKSVGKTALDDAQIAEITRSAIWKQSEPKLEYLKKLLIENSIQSRKERLKTNIRTELERQSVTYVNFLNGFTCSEGAVGDYVAQNFPMDEFLKALYEVFFEEKEYENEVERDLIIERKISDIKSVMRQYQNSFITDFINKLKE